MTGSYCSLQEILIMSYLPDSSKVRSGPGGSVFSPAAGLKSGQSNRKRKFESRL